MDHNNPETGEVEDRYQVKPTTKQIVLIIVCVLGLMIFGVLLAIVVGLY
jgi:hypothetical protein